MSFLEEIKEELLNLRIKKSCCMASEIKGILVFGGVPFEDGIFFGTESFHLAKRFTMFLRKCCDIDFENRLNENAGSYKFVLPERIIEMLGLYIENGNVKSEECDNECCMHAFVRGAFLVSGSAASPEKAYRVEIFSENEFGIDMAEKYLEKMSVAAKKVKRKKHFVIYSPNSEAASDMLKAAEATGAVFKMLEVKVTKKLRNGSNRAVNCDMANITRAEENSLRESEAIRFIEKTVGLDYLKPKLKAAAILRLENEGASLKELCELSEVPIAKSTLNNRLNKLIQIAEELRK